MWSLKSHGSFFLTFLQSHHPYVTGSFSPPAASRITTIYQLHSYSKPPPHPPRTYKHTHTHAHICNLAEQHFIFIKCQHVITNSCFKKATVGYIFFKHRGMICEVALTVLAFDGLKIVWKFASRFCIFLFQPLNRTTLAARCNEEKSALAQLHM